MIDRRKKLHREICDGAEELGLDTLEASIPNSTVVEQMGLRRAPVGAWAPRTSAARAYRRLWREARDSIGDRLGGVAKDRANGPGHAGLERRGAGLLEREPPNGVPPGLE